MFELVVHLASSTHDGPTWSDVVEAVTLRTYNTRLVVVSTMIFGAAAGLIGSFLLLRKRSLIGDALSHATFPGVCIAFMVVVAFGGDGKSLPALLLGAAIAGLLGVGCVVLIRSTTRLKDDAALGIVLSVFFALGTALMKIMTQMPGANVAGIKSFIFGRAASLVFNDFIVIAVAAALCVIVCLLLYKEFTLLCFDEGFAGAQGWPVGRLDAAMLIMVTLVTVVGLQAVGLILVIAMLIIPPAAARFWTEHLPTMTATAAVIGAVSGYLGAALSAVYEDLPAGAIIVLVAAAVFIVSMLFGSARGVLVRAAQHWRLARTTQRQHVLRAIFEATEPTEVADAVELDKLLSMRSWTPPHLRRVLRRLRRDELVAADPRGRWQLTESGRLEAQRLVRNHRLWELYLITHADIAPSHVDRDADMIEHVLGPVMVAKLEQLLKQQRAAATLPGSPHSI